MAKSIIVQVVNEAELRIEKGLKECQSIIDDFAKPLDIPWEPDKKRKYLDERISGRLSVKSLEEAYDRKLTLENEKRDLMSFRYYQKELFNGEK